MESSRLPIDVCEEVMNALYRNEHELSESDDRNMTWEEYTFERQPALCACALTCRAWRARAQHLLLAFPHLHNIKSLSHFITAIQRLSNVSSVALALGHYYPQVTAPWEPFDPSTTSGLFMRSFPHLQRLEFYTTHFYCGPPLQVFRMRLPFFASITTLRLLECTFRSWRAMLDVVWACPNLAMLDIVCGIVKTKHTKHYLSAAELQQMCAAVENLRGCRKLTTLILDGGMVQNVWDPASWALSGGGRMFGSAITELIFESDLDTGEALGSLLRDSFPALRSVNIISDSDPLGYGPDDGVSPFLHAIAIGRPRPGTLKTIVLQERHDRDDEWCCEKVVGEKGVQGPAQQLPELLPELTELVIRLNRCEFPERHVPYIHSVLAGMSDVLQIQYRDYDSGDWALYTLPATK